MGRFLTRRIHTDPTLREPVTVSFNMSIPKQCPWHRWIAAVAVTASVHPVGAQLLAPSMAPNSHAIHAGVLIDPTDGSVRHDQVVLVENGVITQVGVGVPIPRGVPIIDLSDYVVLPGLMDAHVHLTARVPRGSRLPAEAARTPMARRLVVGVLQARETLLAGFTTVRDIGNSGDYVDVELRDAIAQGIVWGPTMLVAGKIIAPFGGQSRLNPERPELGEIEYLYADTPDAMVRAVRQNIHFGADLIKIVVDDQAYLYSTEDIALIVREAARAGRDVAAHVLTDQGARNAIEGGVASLEHGWRMSDATLDLARDRGVALVTTDFSISAMEVYGWPDSLVQARRLLVVDRLRRALAHDVTVVFGSDLIWASAERDRGAWSIEQLASLAESGATPRQMLQILIANPSRLMHLEGTRGRIAVGQAADIIATRKNPLEDVTAFQDVVFVMTNGRVAKAPSP